MIISIRRGLTAVLAVLAALLTSFAVAAPARAATNDQAVSVESVRAMTWNMCGESGGSTPVPPTLSPSYCPYRNTPSVKVAAIESMIAKRNLNAVILQEICSGPNSSHLTPLQNDLGPKGWTFAWVTTTRDTGTSYCRGTALSGTYSMAIGVKGQITNSVTTALPIPANHESTPVLCVSTAGWQTEVCGVHLNNDSSGVSYASEISTVKAAVAPYKWLVLGGDFNTSTTSNVQPLYDLFPECDALSYSPNDYTNEPTHAVLQSDGTYKWTKIDYLFSTAGFTGCDSERDYADTTPYSATVQTPGPTAYSDHAPLYGYTRGVPQQAWNLHDGTGTTAADSSGNGNPGALAGGTTWTSDRTGSLSLDGTGSVTGTLGVSTDQSFSVSAWVDVAAGAPTGAIASQDGQAISKFILWYEADDNTWRFGMPQSDSSGWTVDQVIPTTHAQTGVWTHLVGSYDYPSGTLSLYANGTLIGQSTHSAQWSATGPLVVGRDKVNGQNNAYLKGTVDDVQLFDYGLTQGQAATLHQAQLAS